MRRTVTLLLLMAVAAVQARGQSQLSAFSFLELPTSAHSMAVGGVGSSVPYSDPALLHANPALLSNTQEDYLTLGYMNWVGTAHVAHALYSKPVKERGYLSAWGKYVGWGKQKLTTSDNVVLGSFTSKDMALGVTYAYRLGGNWSGGVSGKFVYSHYSHLSSLAVAVDLGIHYRNPEKGMWVGVSALNCGGQITPFEDRFEKLPFNLTAELTYQLKHAPLKVTFGMSDLTRWSAGYYYSTEELSFKDILYRHISLGTHVDITDQLWVALGLNVRNRMELSTEGGRGLAGFSLGGGVRLNKIIVGLAYSRYQVQTSSLLLSVAYNL